MNRLGRRAVQYLAISVEKRRMRRFSNFSLFFPADQ